jgi:DNA-directed RNA polymerase alpha subunit|tara:strand:- start:1273 stop:1719 length:447 start_codon:yes stop_codon:yes gene_type:complete
MKDLTKYVMIPYEEYQHLISVKQKDSIDEKYEIYFQPLKTFINTLEISVRTYNLLVDILEDRIVLSKSSKIALKQEYPNRAEDVIERFKKFQFVGDLVSKSSYDFLFLSGFGRKGLNELKDDLKRLNLSINTNLSEGLKDKLEQLRAK